jgi:hypothetical protein
MRRPNVHNHGRERIKAMAHRPARPHQPDALECAILLLLLVQPKERTRIRLAEITLKRLWQRRRLGDEFVAEVQEWLFRAGWALFYAGTTFGLVKTKSVEGWPRVTSKDLETELEKVVGGRFDFSRHYHLVLDDETEE